MLTNLSRYVLCREFHRCLHERAEYPCFSIGQNLDLSDLLHDLDGLMGVW